MHFAQVHCTYIANSFNNLFCKSIKLNDSHWKLDHSCDRQLRIDERLHYCMLTVDSCLK